MIVSNESIPRARRLLDSLPLGEPVSYQIEMHGRIRLVIIEEESLRLPDPDVYTRLFTELYAASQFGVRSMYKQESLDLRVYGLLADGEYNAVFSYDPVSTAFQMDEMVNVARGCDRALHDMMRLSEKLFSILMHGYNEFLDHWFMRITSLPQEDLIEYKRSDLSLVEDPMYYANQATAQLQSPTDGDALERGLDDLRKR
ncbi:hypothetical protein EDD85DRAFT_953407 [Armillaria nabsnona]|nr:hypothetical protein EDD85DRAFT_953407 [Armillaria nabsnona]